MLDRKGFIFDNSAVNKRRPIAAAIFVAVLGGSIGLIHLMSQQRFAAIRTVDVVQLLGSGMCFGAGLTAVIAMIRTRRSE